MTLEEGNLKSCKDQINNDIKSKAWYQIYLQVYNNSRTQVYGDITFKVANQVTSQLQFQVKNKFLNHLQIKLNSIISFANM